MPQLARSTSNSMSFSSRPFAVTLEACQARARGHELGDRKPRALVNYLLSTLGKFGPEILLQHVFLRALPAHVQDALAASDCTDLECLGNRADLIMAPPPLRLSPSALCSLLTTPRMPSRMTRLQDTTSTGCFTVTHGATSTGFLPLQDSH